MTEFWAEKAKRMIAAEHQVTLVTVGQAKGSIPRSEGTKMLIGSRAIFGTIGGGNLEFQVMEQARRMLAEPEKTCLYQAYALGPLLKQCCGGSVKILLEKMDKRHFPFLDQVEKAHNNGKAYGMISATGGDQVDKRYVDHKAPDGYPDHLEEWVEPPARPLYMFGAGHVGRATAKILENLNFKVCWIDGRADEFPDQCGDNIEKIISEDPVSYVAQAPKASIFLVFTHSHQLDYEITAAALGRGDAAYCGMIGSLTKRKRFELFCQHEGLRDAAIAKLTCPIGLDQVAGKSPQVIAVAVAAELLSLDKKDKNKIYKNKET